MPVETIGSTRLVSTRLLRGLLAAWLGGAFGIFALVGIKGLGGPRPVVILATLAIAACIGWFFWRRPAVPLDEKSSPILIILFVLAAIGSLVQIARLSVYIVNPAAVSYAVGPHRGVGLPVRHLCMTAYYVAAKAVATVPNVYDDTLYALPTPPDALPKQRPIGPFLLDRYEYPPPFLLLPRALAVVAPQLLNFRMLWFALNGSILLIGLLAVAQMFDPVVGTRVLLLSPLLLAAEITVGTLQIGNVQLTVLALAMIAMVLFAKGRYAAGGALLAFATVSKLFPGMLIVYLAARREWRALAWTVGLCGALVGISLLDTGRAPYLAFLHHLPRLLSGEAFPAAFRHPGAIARNMSVPGFFFKLKLFGLPNGSFAGVKLIGQIYTLIVLAATVLLARQTPERNMQPLIWLTILILGSLRSPFLTQYGLFPAVWLLILLAAMVVPAVRALGLMLIAWAILNIPAPLEGDPRWAVAVVLLTQAVMAVLVALTLRRWRESPVQA